MYFSLWVFGSAGALLGLARLGSTQLVLMWGPRLWWSSHSLGHVLLPVEAPECEQKHTMPPKASAGDYWPAVTSAPIPIVPTGPRAQGQSRRGRALLGKRHGRGPEE